MSKELNRTIKNLWIVVDSNDLVFTESIDEDPYKSREKFLTADSHLGLNMNWNYWCKKQGYRCIKVDITFKEIKPL